MCAPYYIAVFGLSDSKYFSILCHKLAILCTIFFKNISHSKKNSERYCRKCTQVLMYSVCCVCQVSKNKEKFSKNGKHNV